MEKKPKIKVILGSTRKGRQGINVANWVMSTARNIKSIDVELLDLKDWKLPYFEEPASPAYAESTPEVAETWSQKISEGDGFIIITPEYNHSFPAVLKNSLDYLYKEWNRKPVGFVSYSAAPTGGTRAVEQLVQIVTELQMHPVRDQVNIGSVWKAFNENDEVFDEMYNKKLSVMLNDLRWWSLVLMNVREEIKA